MTVQNAKPPIDVFEYHRMTEIGFYAEDDRTELIEGEIVRMAAIGIRHASCVDYLTNRLAHNSRQEWIVRIQNPLRLNEMNEPQPDVMLLKRRDDYYRNRHPEPADVLLLIEVSDNSLDYDRGTKLPLYARAGIQEAWIIDLVHHRIEIHSEPEEGAYRVVSPFGADETAISTVLPRFRFRLSDLTGSEDA